MKKQSIKQNDKWEKKELLGGMYNNILSQQNAIQRRMFSDMNKSMDGSRGGPTVNADMVDISSKVKLDSSVNFT